MANNTDMQELAKVNVFQLDINKVTKDALDVFCAGTGIQGEDMTIQVTDFLCALMHLNKVQDFNLDECWSNARDEYLDDIKQR